MLKGVIKICLILCIGIAVQSNAYAQFTIQHQAPTAFPRGEATQLEFIAAGLNQNDIQVATLYYRNDGDFGYDQKEAIFQNGTFTVTLTPDDPNTASIEYYFEVTLISGQNVTFPDNTPSDNPIQVQITDQKDKELEQLQNVDYTILSPQPGNAYSDNDLIIAIALFYDKNNLDPGTFEMILDGKNITSDADTSDYYLSYVPKGLRRGPHNLRIEYKTQNQAFLLREWQFFVVDPSRATFQGFGDVSASRTFTPSGRIQLTARNQVIGGDENNALTGRATASGAYGDLRYSVNSFLTSQESSRLQPQNRYGLDLEYGRWWNFELGHVFPRMSNFTISGRRVLGLNTSLHLLNRNLNFQFVYGELDRSVTNVYDQLLIEEQTTSTGQVVDTTYTLTYGDNGRGTFKREVIGGRVGFGNEEKFQMGLHALKIQDDTTSIFNVRDYNSLLNASSDLYSNLSAADRQKLAFNPDILDVQGGAVSPKGNMVAGTDMKLNLNNNRIRFQSEAVISALNDNIYGGPLTVERADELGFDLTQDDVDVLERLSWLIIINENITTLPLRIRENENGEDETEAFFPTSSIAGNSELAFNYPSNNLRIQYRWIGPNFNSLANSTIRKDVAGYTITDRLTLLQNRIYLTLGYEKLNDNVVGNKRATIETKTYRSNISWYPVTRELPRVSIGFRYRDRANGVERFNPNVPAGFENAAVRNLSTENDSLTTPTPRMNNTLNINAAISQQLRFLDMVHDLSLSYFNLNTEDEVFAFGDVNSQSLSLNLTTRFNTLPLRSQLGLTFNSTESGSGQSEVDIFGMYVGGNYSLLDNKLFLNGRLAFTSNDTRSNPLTIFDDGDNNPLNDYFVLSDNIEENSFSTFVIQAGAQYDLDQNHSLLFDANLTNVSGAGRSNDRIVELRYIFRF